MNKVKEIKIDFFRVVVTLFVVYAHSTRMFTGYGAIVGPYYNLNPILKNITEFIYGFHMPFFFFISGLVYCICIEKGKYKEKLKFIKNKFLRLIVPYIIFGIFYVVPIMYMLNIREISLFQGVISIIFLGDSRHLWFLPTLFLIFMIAMFIKPKNTKSCIVFIIIFTIITYFSKYFSSVFFNVMYYLVYFYLGYFFELIYKKIEGLNNNKLVFLSFITVIIYIILYIVNIRNVFLSIVGCCMLFFILYLVNINLYKDSKLFQLLKNNSMGVYLFHPMIIYLFYYFLKNIYFNPYIFSFIVALVSLLISILLTLLVKKIKLNFILGEK